MICGLQPRTKRSPFHATTVGFAGMLICIFVTLAVLVSVSQDQSGAALVEVASSFNASLQDQGGNDATVLFTAFRNAAATSENEREKKSRPGIKVARTQERNDSLLGEAYQDDTKQVSYEEIRPADLNGPVFAHLMTELQRYFHVSRASHLGGQLTLDLHSSVSRSEDDIHDAIERILKTCRTPDISAGPLPAEFEVIVWASSPAAESLASASKDALALERSLEASLAIQPAPTIRIISSGRIWTRSYSPRPLATVVVRAPRQ